MQINTDGILTHNSTRFIASPNCDKRPADTEITLLVIHHISLPPDDFGGDGVIELFTNRLKPDAHPYYATISDLKVSSHFFIRRTGEIIQFVSCLQRAWHAGISYWQDKECCNDFSIGIELEGNDTTPFTEAQYTVLVALTRCLNQRYPIADIAGHADIAPGRKTDPGAKFNWAKYANALNDETYFKKRADRF